MEFNQHPLFDTSCLCPDDCLITEGSGRSAPFVNDHLFVFDGPEFKDKITNIKPVDLLTNMLYSYVRGNHNYPSLPAAHTLWMEWILYSKFKVTPALPHLLTGNGPSEGKTNKEWNI